MSKDRPVKVPRRSAAHELGLQLASADLFERRIEAFDVAHLKERAGFFRELREFFGCQRRQGQRLFHQDRYAAAQEFGGDRFVAGGGHDDAGGVHQVEERPVIAEGLRAHAFGYCFGLFRIDVRDANEVHVRQAGQDARVLLAQVTNANDRHSQTRHILLIPACLLGG